MPSLVVPRSGLTVEVGTRPAVSSNGLLGITLSDNVIEDMIQCVQNGEEIQLSLDVDSTISYGSNSLHLTSSEDPFSYDIYQNSTSTNSPKNNDSAMSNQLARGPRKPGSAGLFWQGPLSKTLNPIRTEKVSALGRPIKQKSGDKAPQSNSKSKGPVPGTDDALETLRNTLAMENAKKSANTTQLVKNTSLPPPVQQRGAAAPLKTGNKNSFASKRKGNLRSLPPSPALAGISSPSLGPTSIPASQQQAEKTKAIRSPIIHKLALGPATEAELVKLRTPAVTEIEFKLAMEKVADLEDGKWKLQPKFFKELDVWKYDYESSVERQVVIDNAIRAYDKMRMNPSEPEWQNLLPVAERGKGKCLSKLQAKIAVSGNFAPKPKPKPMDDSSRESAGEDDIFGEKATKSAKGVGMARSTSQNPATKSKAAKEREAQDKRLSGKSAAAKPAPKKPVPKKPAKETFKSSKFVSESEEEDNYLIDPNPAPKPTSSTKKVQPVEQKSSKPNAKRMSDNKDATESVNGLAKKPKTLQTSSSSSLSGSAHRASDSNQTSRDVKTLQRSINNTRARINTSPQKSSPLASSPPTNASDIDDIDQSTSVSPSTDSMKSLKRRAIDSELEESPKKKRTFGRTGVSDAEMRSVYDKGQFRHVPIQCLEDSAKFQVFYDRYHKLYLELKADPSRLQKEHRELMKMHDRLAEMKKNIIESARDKSRDS